MYKDLWYNEDDMQPHRNCETIVDSFSRKIIYTNIDSAPRFKNGPGDFIRYINKNIKPKTEWTEDQSFKSTDKVSFIVYDDGTLLDFYIIGKQNQEPVTDLEEQFVKLIKIKTDKNLESCTNGIHQYKRIRLVCWRVLAKVAVAFPANSSAGLQ